MKKSKRILAIIMAIAMITTLLVGLTASAAVGDVSITINAPANLTFKDQEFYAFRIFNVRYVEPVPPATEYKFAYTILPEYVKFETDNAALLGGLSLFEYLTTLTSHSDEMNILAEALWNYTKDEGIDATGYEKCTTDATTVVIDKLYTGDPDDPYDDPPKELPLGYYLVFASGHAIEAETDDDTQVIAAVALTTTYPKAVINLKADAPQLDKLIWNHHKDDEDGNRGVWDKWNDVNIGDTVFFRLETAVPKMIGYSADKFGYKFIIHDIMSSGLTFDPGSVEIYLGGPKTDYDATDPGDPFDFDKADPKVSLLEPASDFYELIIDFDKTDPDYDGCTFEIVFDPLVFVNFTPEQAIYVYYSAVLNEGAVIELPGNPNDAQLEYSNNPYWDEDNDDDDGTNKTPWKRVKVYTGKLGFIKIIGDADEGPDGYILATLAGAEFELWKDPTDPTSALWFYGPYEYVDDDGAKVNGYMVISPEQKAARELAIYMIFAAAIEAAEAESDPDVQQAMIDAAWDEYNKASAFIGTILVTPENGRVLIIGLGASYESEEYDPIEDEIIYVYDDYGDYWLVEINPPMGYLPREGGPIPVQLQIISDYDGDFTDRDDEASWDLDCILDDGLEWIIITWKEKLDANGDPVLDANGDPVMVPGEKRLAIRNYSAELPETGGTGRNIFVIGGIILMCLAIVGLVATTVIRKKKIVVE